MRLPNDHLSAMGTERGAEAWLMGLALLLGLLGATLWLLSLTGPTERPGRVIRWVDRLIHFSGNK